MITILHHSGAFREAVCSNAGVLKVSASGSMCEVLFEVAASFPEALIVWCEEQWRDSFNENEVASIFHHQRIMASYSVSGVPFFPKQLGYVENSPFVKVVQDITYPTWQMSSDVGGVYASVLNAVASEGLSNANFSFFLNVLAKQLMPHGLLCYSEPKLVKGKPSVYSEASSKASEQQLFNFIKANYKTRWLWFALLCVVIYEKRVPIFSFLRALSFRRKKVSEGILTHIPLESTIKSSRDNSIDVIIPTMGRKAYLHDVLKDLSQQTLMPSRVIVVEQDPDPNASSSLDYIASENWPFEIILEFTHRTGACRARNLALTHIRSDWVFMADDDIRFPPSLLKSAMQFLQTTNASAFTMSCLMEGEQESVANVVQWMTFGSGCSIVASEIAKETQYNLALEFGYGEDKDYGMQLRNKGCDVLYTPFIQLKHLKAPMGGFRQPVTKPWGKEKLAPKPAPTVMRFQLDHRTAQQTKGYKLQLFIKYYRNQSVKNPFTYIKKMKKAWNSSVSWAKQL